MSHVQRLELCGQSRPPHNPSDRGEQRGGLGRKWGSGSKYQSLGPAVLAFTLAKEARVCF